MRPRYSRDTAEMQPRYSRNTIGVHLSGASRPHLGDILAICRRYLAQVSAPRHYPAILIGIMCLVADWVIIETPVTLIGVHNLGSGAGIIASIVVVQARTRRDPQINSPRSIHKFAEIHG